MRPRYSYCFFWFFSTISSSKTSFPFDAEIIKKNQTDSIAVYFIFETKFAICKLCFHCHSWEIMEKNCVKKLYFWQISTSYIFLIRPLICVMLVYVWQLIRKQFPICVTNSFVVNILILFSVFKKLFWFHMNITVFSFGFFKWKMLSVVLMLVRYGFRSKPELVLIANPWVGDREVNLSPLTDWIEKKLAIEFQVWHIWLFQLHISV